MVPAKHDRYNATNRLGDLEKGRLGHVEMRARWVAPTTVVGVLRPVRGADIGGGDGGDGRPLVAPLGVITTELEALPAPIPVFEQYGAQCCRVRIVTTLEQVSVAACPTC